MKKWMWVYGFLLVLVAQDARTVGAIELKTRGQVELSISPTSLNFGSVPLGIPSPKAIVLTRPDPWGYGGVELTPQITGPAAADFDVSNGLGCLGSTEKGRCNAEVVFRPSGLGERRATLVLDNSYRLEGRVAGIERSSNPIATISLIGHGISPIVVTPTSLVFDKQNAFSYSAAKRIMVKSNVPGGFNMNITGITFSGPNSRDFQGRLPLDCSRTPLGGSCPIYVTFTPSTGGPMSATLIINGIIGPAESPYYDWYGGTPPSPGPGPQPMVPPTTGSFSPLPQPVFTPVPGRPRVPSPFPVTIQLSGTGA